MLKEAIDALRGTASHRQIIDWVHSTYGAEVNEGTIRAQINICTVNSPSRIYYPENQKPRLASGRHDFLYSTGRGQVTLYDPEKHGQWAIQKRNGGYTIAQVGVDGETVGYEEAQEAPEVEGRGGTAASFPLESHLRDFLARNLDSVDRGLQLYRDENGREGLEYPTDVGPIDILAKASNGELVVFELKLSRGPDRALGQLLRYMGWVKERVSKGGSPVRGIIVANQMDEPLKYAASVAPSVTLLEYEVSFKVRPVELTHQARA